MSSTQPPEQNRANDPEPTTDTPRETSGAAQAGHPGAPNVINERAEQSSASDTAPIGPPAGVGSERGIGPARFAPGGTAAGPGGRRRWPWVVGGIAVVIVALLVGAAIGLGIAHHARGHQRFAGGPGIGARPWGHGGRRAMMHGGPFGGRSNAVGAIGPARSVGTTVLLGSVTSLNGANLVVAADAASAPVTVTVSDQTKVAGGQVRALSQLKAGDRVAVRIAPDHSASGVMLIPATTRGTITTLSGTAVTVMQPDGLPQAVDTSGLPTQPQMGDLVAVTGTASGSTIKAQNLRELPKTG